MREADYKPQRGRRRTQVPESVLHDTARYIAAEWEKELPGCTTGDQPEVIEAAILDFMRRCGIQTVEDYEESLIKDQAAQQHFLHPTANNRLPRTGITRL